MLLVERPRLGPRGWRYEARAFVLYTLMFLGFAALAGAPAEVGGWGWTLAGAVVLAGMAWVIRVVVVIGWGRRRLTVTDRAIRIGSVLVPLADVVDLRALRGPELGEAEREGQVTGSQRIRVHESQEQALLVTQRQLDGRVAGWMFGTHDVDQLARIVGEHIRTELRPDPAGTPRPLPFHGRQGVDRFRAGMLLVWGLMADTVLWIYSDRWPFVTGAILALLTYTGRRRIRIDERGIRVGTARFDADQILAVRCVERAEASGASVQKSRLPLFGPPAALLVHTDDDELWAFGIPHPLDVDHLVPARS